VSTPAEAPPGYEALERAGARVVCRADSVDALDEALAGGSLYAWAAAHPARRELRGRAAAWAVPLPHGAGDVVVRHSWHGGLLAPLTRDLFLPPTRAPRELDASLRLAAAGVRTPAVVAYVVYPAGPLFRRADVATRLVPDGRDLAAAIADREAPSEEIEGPTGSARIGAWVRPAGALLHALAAAGARHPDLNLKNVLLTPAADPGGHTTHHAWVLDVDVVRLTPGPVTAAARWAAGEANFARLARSLRKWREERGLRVSDLELDALRECGRHGADAEIAVKWRPGHSPVHAS
jgi:3-deoxy-D-manno-octulosonic acid kinase